MELLKYDTSARIVAFSTRRGEGEGAYDAFNITHYCGDTPQHVAACREELCRELGIEDSCLLLPRQTHGNKVARIDAEFMSLDKAAQTEALDGVDAVVTALRGICIGVSTADCIPLLLHDTRLNVVAAVHAGWRGTVAAIAAKCIETMQEYYGCQCSDIRAIIAPGISLEAFEVGDEVDTAFADAGFAMERIARRYPTANGGTKWHIDLWEANRLQLIALGIPCGNIHVAGICTWEQHREFFSARRLGINSGRIFSGIMVL